ncbi:hypothetical protein DO97_13270 [Neosynechococcus sphagnicola sy1]|uniref:Uncharacterized protein n=1 Tax=Neosynechococcus sphagnicola sy1 TaxID=1497020 RepID=A0A098THE8_9CYAN|nr:hypothetical protein DO97_13270 [Neosynechococcus sphagnicola sy1]
MKYLATTYPQRIPQGQIFMVDGTVPGWQPQPADYHWDHHRLDGALIQIDEMPLPQSLEQSLITELTIGQEPILVTTAVDADACIAAAWLQLPRQLLQQPEILARLRAIAFDCDHLGVPPALSHLSDFAANAVATLKLHSQELAQRLGLSGSPKNWTEAEQSAFHDKSFEQITQWLIAAVHGDRPWPGTQGEAAAYGQQILEDSHLLLVQQRVQLIQGLPVFEIRGIGKAIDPRACLQAGRTLCPPRPETLTVRRHRLGGIVYTLGCDPEHPLVGQLNYCQGTYQQLTAAEVRKQSTASTDPWGGRRTVGGSGWNTPSLLSPEEVAEILVTPLGR